MVKYFCLNPHVAPKSLQFWGLMFFLNSYILSKLHPKLTPLWLSTLATTPMSSKILKMPPCPISEGGGRMDGLSKPPILYLAFPPLFEIYTKLNFFP